MQQLFAAVAVAAPLALGLVTSPSSGQQILHFADPAITEASSLVVQDGLYITSNDSGHTGRVFAVDATGTTVGVTRWSAHPRDTEAMAPGGPGYVWVGDIGDNDGRRRSVGIALVPVGRGDRTVEPTTYRLRYPDGPADAETLMRNPATGRLYVATKGILGGVLYAVPQHLRPADPNRLHSIGRVLPVATDGAFFPDGKHLIVRNYTSAVVYAWPSLQPVGSLALPRQRQGEGIAVADDGSVYVSSEGPHSLVLEVALPKKIEAAVQPAVSQAPPAPSASAPTTRTRDSAATRDGELHHDAWPWLAGGLLGLVAIGVLILAVRPR